MKIISLLLILTLTSCSGNSSKEEKYSYYGYDPSKMTEKEIYLTWGLEAPSNIYTQLKENMDKKGFGTIVYCDHVTKENPLSNFIGINVKVDSLKISKASVEPSDYSNKFNKLIERLLVGMKWDDEKGNDKHSGDFGFRIDVNKLCK